MKKLGSFVIMAMLAAGCYAQKVTEGSLSPLAGQKKMKVELNYTGAVLKGMSYKDYVAQEENWDKGIVAIQAKFVESFNSICKGKMNAGPYDDANYTLRVDAIKVEKRGTTTATAVVLDAEGKEVAKFSEFVAEGGTWGTHINLMGDAAINMGARLGKFFKKIK